MLRPEIEFTGLSRISDEALMEAITRRQPRALNEFFSRHGNRIKSVIGSVVHEEGDADDVLQEILIQVWRESGRYSPKAGKLLGWVVTLARRRAIDRLRRKQAYVEQKNATKPIWIGCQRPRHRQPRSTIFRGPICGAISIAV